MLDEHPALGYCFQAFKRCPGAILGEIAPEAIELRFYRQFHYAAPRSGSYPPRSLWAGQRNQLSRKTASSSGEREPRRIEDLQGIWVRIEYPGHEASELIWRTHDLQVVIWKEGRWVEIKQINQYSLDRNLDARITACQLPKVPLLESRSLVLMGVYPALQLFRASTEEQRVCPLLLCPTP
jgi:hypothetical protein